MAYIQPNTDIILCKGITWTNNYEDTPYFKSTSEQYAYIAGMQKIRFTRNSYQRHSSNTLRILCTADQVYDCNYLMFQNTSYGSKWFYAFITNCEYINDNTTEITYEVDEVQTWFWTLTLGKCFVEREIPETDNLFENTIPEGLDLGELIINDFQYFDLNDTVILLISMTDANGNYPNYNYGDAWKGVVNDVFLPLFFETYERDNTGAQQLYDFITLMASKGYAENIVSINIVPRFCLEHAFSRDGGTAGAHYASDYKEIAQTPTFGGYLPKNKKLYTYPYNFITVSNNQGQVKEYHWENFRTLLPGALPTVGFQITGCIYTNPTIRCSPDAYLKAGVNVDESVVISNFTPVPWINDAFQAYLAQNKASITTSLLGSVISAGFSAASGNVGGAAMAAVGAAKTMSSTFDKQALPTTPINLVQCDALNLILTQVRFEFKNYCVNPEYAKKIDDYFSLYGYALHSVKVPNISSRPAWNYTKTQGCIIKGNCPASSKTFIENCFNKGIRFWKNPAKIGDYEMPNNP